VEQNWEGKVNDNPTNLNFFGHRWIPLSTIYFIEDLTNKELTQCESMIFFLYYYCLRYLSVQDFIKGVGLMNPGFVLHGKESPQDL
jgi:hypothetical protein